MQESTWSENEYELNKTYAFDTVSFSEWLTELYTCGFINALTTLYVRDIIANNKPIRSTYESAIYV